MKVKIVMRKDTRRPLLSLFRLLWTHGVVGDGKGYSAKLSFAMIPRIVYWRRDRFEWLLIVMGLRIHYRRSYGGIIV